MIRHLKVILSSILFSALIAVTAYGVPFGNEWINFNQTYYKIPIAETGIYKITYTDLQDAGFPVNAVDPRRIKLYHHGNEQAIIVDGQLDAQLNPGDFIEFYGKRNDGTLDTRLYRDPEAQVNKYHNLYSDTSAYFLTWSLDGSNGKRIENFKENNVDGLPAEPYHFRQDLTIQHSRYSLGLHYPLGQVSAENFLTIFDYGEGWTGNRIRKGNAQDFAFESLQYAEDTGPVPKAEIMLVGANNLDHTVDIMAGPSTSNLRTITTSEFEYYNNEQVNIDLEWNDLSADGNLYIRVYVQNSGSNADFVSVSYVSLTIPEQLNQDGNPTKYYQLAANSEGKSYIEVNSVPTNSRIFDITDPNNILQVAFNRTSADIDAIVPNTTSSRQLFVSKEVLTPPDINQISFKKFNPTNYNYLILTHNSMRKPGGNYDNVIDAYENYRSSSQGGNFSPLTFNISDLYNQFSYGETSSLAIYNFVDYMLANANPRYLLIIGKGLTPNYNSHRKDFDAQEYPDLVPTGGYPGNDMIFSTGLQSGNDKPQLPTGRISSTNTEQVAAYLDKVKDMESQPYDGLWRKEIIHLSGGGGLSEQTIFRRYVDQFKNVATGLYLGGEVVTKSKKTNNDTELINIAELVNEGKSLITFFGHSSSSITDIEIGFVTNDALGYDNYGKYPAILVNGCNAGDAYFPGTGFGLDWIHAADKGAISFIAHTGIGNSVTLKRYTQEFYNVGYGDSLYIEKGIGDIQVEVADNYLSKYLNTEINVSQAQQMALQGDPAVKLFGAKGPDFEIAKENVFTESPNNQPITVFTEQFDLGIITRNFGKSINDSLQVSVTRELSDGTIIDLGTHMFKRVLYKDTLYFTIPSAGVESFGNNKFTITLDPENDISELNELNNQVVFEYFVPLGGTVNRYPRNFSIVDTTQLNLVAHSLDLLMGERTFSFELDTTDQFNSSLLQSENINADIVAKWNVDLSQILNLPDTQTFFWRSKYLNPREGELNEWTEHSFTYIKNGATGWNMSHFEQFKSTSSKLIEPNRTTRNWEFKQFSTDLLVRTYGGNHPDFDHNDVQLEINETPYIYPGKLCTNNSINLVSFKQSTTSPYKGMNFSGPDILDRKICGRVPQVINNFIDSEIETPNEYIVQYVDNIPEGDFVLLFSIGSVSYQNWTANTYNVLSEIGVNQAEIIGMQAGEPLIILGKKGATPGTAKIVKASTLPADEQEISLDDVLTGTVTKDEIKSPTIGPTYNWGTLSFDIESLEEPTTDEYYLKVYGINKNSKESLLINNVESSPTDLSIINAAEYPNIKVGVFTKDEDQLTPSQLQKLTVTYEDVPEGILTFNERESDKKDYQEGALISRSFTFENLSDVDYQDSIMVEHTIFNRNTRTPYTDTIKIEKLNAWEQSTFDIDIESLEKIGENDLRVFANPNVELEVTYNNNLITQEQYATVNADVINPVLEVTFDGEYIMDGDIVSPSPSINIRMKDENTVLQKQDTTGIKIMLKKPCEMCALEQIPFSSPRVNWTPATKEQAFSVHYKPENLEDGIYTLSVQAEDASGNQSGTSPYKVNFEVVNESTITNFFPYPNPFSTSTKFVFTLTGSEIPDKIKIQIMTISGTVVREITQDEIGPVKIGNNVTEFSWDGTDEYGDKLANGVYLYRVKVYKNGEPIKQRATSADRAFKNGMSKIYILR